MEQISLPYRIALGALLVIGALWFTILRPQPEAASPPPTAPGVAGLARATQNAKNAVASKSSAAESQAASNRPGQTRSATPTKATAGVTKSPAAATSPNAAAAKPAVVHHRVVPRKTAPGAATKPSPTLVQADGGKDPSAPLLADLDRGRTLVLLFWNKKGSDDRAVRSALKGVGHHHARRPGAAVPDDPRDRQGQEGAPDHRVHLHRRDRPARRRRARRPHAVTRRRGVR